MHRVRLVIAGIAVVALVALLMGGCGGTGAVGTSAEGALAPAGATAPVTTQLAMASPQEMSAPATTAMVTPSALGFLTLRLSTTLDGTGTLKATSLTKAELLNTKRVVVANATITTGVASFAVSTLLKGHYFIRVNGLPNDLVPTKLDNPLTATNQFVGRTLRTSVIGTLAAPKYKFVTYSLGQTQHTVVGYTNGLAGTPVRYGYALLYLSLNKLETRVLGTGALLASVPLGHHSTATWVVGPTNHGKSISASCTSCHGSATSKPATYASISTSNGWCYKCHYGSAGVSSGLVDPKK